MKTKAYLISLLAFMLIMSFNSFSQTNDECSMCHEDNTLTGVSGGKTISMFVDNSKFSRSAHAKLSCIECHSDLKGKDFPHADNLKKVNCSSCHLNYDKTLENDIHSRLNLKNKPNFTCQTCHTYHDTKKIASVSSKNNQYCGQCHKTNVLTAPYHAKTEVNESCKNCHKATEYSAELKGSVHGSLSCSNCHGFVVNNLEEHQKGNKKNKTADCFVCHADIAKQHKESIHGVSLLEGIEEAAQCWSCHGSHNIQKVESNSSSANLHNLVKTCGKCHDNEKFTKKHFLSVKNPAILYENSVHGQLFKAGNDSAPNCTSCHGVHDIKNRVQENSTISDTKVAETCSQCHQKEAEEYMQSVHWFAVKKGMGESPTCNDCHSEHGIKAVNATKDKKIQRRIQDNTCLVCHESLILAERFSLAGENVSKYKDSYHGRAVQSGDEDAAMCVDCHGVHKILPSYHEEATTHINNVTATCQKCHEGATSVFSQSYSHVTPDIGSARLIESIVEKVYLWLIIIVIGGMMVHNLLIFIHDIREKRKHEGTQIKVPRFTKNELIQHTLLLTSFILLAITGFIHKFPGSITANFLTDIGINETSRKYIHRVSALVMIALSIYHVVYLGFTQRGRSVLKGLLPVMNDIKAAIQNVKYYLRLTNKHPEFDNYNYIEKAEYWALIWGTIVMGVTGAVLWFPTIVGEWAPIWFIKVSEIIHLYEAILATLAIIVWHWFFVIFRPKEYPINFTSIDGKMTVHHYKEEHKMRFNKIIMEWLEVKNGLKEERKMSHLTKLFMSAVEKNNVDLNEFVKSEVEKDEKLSQFVQEKNLNI